MVGRQEKILNSRILEGLKQSNFDLSNSLLMFSALKVFLAFLCFPFFFLLRFLLNLGFTCSSLTVMAEKVNVRSP